MSFDQWVNVHQDQPLAWDDDVVLWNAETHPKAEKAIRYAREYVRRGHVPQLRMALHPGDTINDYLAALDNPTTLRQIRRRAATHLWRTGGAKTAGGPDQGKFRSPDLPYLRAMLAFTYGDVEPPADPEAAKELLDEPLFDVEEVRETVRDAFALPPDAESREPATRESHSASRSPRR
jgi:hypothetical protein